MEETMQPTTAFDDNVFDINALLHPGTIFDHPREVVTHLSLSISEKRAILASWASDASAIASCPALRAPTGLNAPVTIDEILEALCELDGDQAIRRGASRTACVPRQGLWPPSKERYHGRNQIAAAVVNRIDRRWATPFPRSRRTIRSSRWKFGGYWRD
jgi:hypothetical protein